MTIRAAILNHWENIRNSYWFVPLLMAAAAVMLSFVTLEIDRRFASWLSDSGWLYTGTAEGARSVLQTVATSMIGVAGVVFSITTVTLTLAARQFGPRIFRNFMRDTGTQIVIGTFISTFLYCLLILRQVHGRDSGADLFVPQASMLVAVLFAVASLGVLIYFIHHVAAKIQTPNVVASVASDLVDSIKQFYPEEVGTQLDSREADDRFRAMIPKEFDDEAEVVRSDDTGYLQQIEANTLLVVAKEHDLLIHMDRRPGDFVTLGDGVMRVWPPTKLNDDVCTRLQNALVLGSQRTPIQDVTFPIGQLVEVASLALSPGVNDLATAEMSIDRLGEGLCLLASRHIPSAYRIDDEGKLRVIAEPVDFPQALDAAISTIRLTGRTHPRVISRLLNVLNALAERARRPEDRAAILTHALLVHEHGSKELESEFDRKKLEHSLKNIRRTCTGLVQRGVAS